MSDPARQARSFGDDALQYDRSRPSYPDELVDDLAAGVGDVLDVGCGTGIFGRLFAARGCNVLGVEHDERMAAVARTHGLAVDIGRFEEWDPAGRTFDLVVSGQAWHWVEPVAGVAQVARVLRPGGRFAACWNTALLPPDLRIVVDDVYGRLAPHLLAESVALGTITTFRAWEDDTLGSTGAFTAIGRVAYEWERTYTVDGWLDELPTHSGHRILPPEQLAQILDELRTRLADHPTLVLAYRTSVLRATRR